MYLLYFIINSNTFFVEFEVDLLLLVSMISDSCINKTEISLSF